MPEMKSTEFFTNLSKRLGLKPGTCRNYLKHAGFKPQDKVQRLKFVECVWSPNQLPDAEKAIRAYMKSREEAQ